MMLLLHSSVTFLCLFLTNVVASSPKQTQSPAKPDIDPHKKIAAKKKSKSLSVASQGLLARACPWYNAPL
jgi:hypothetical protein